jgi:hypothetical protein
VTDRERTALSGDRNDPINTLCEPDCVAFVLIDQGMNGFAHAGVIDLPHHD